MKKPRLFKRHGIWLCRCNLFTGAASTAKKAYIIWEGLKTDFINWERETKA